MKEIKDRKYYIKNLFFVKLARVRDIKMPSIWGPTIYNVEKYVDFFLAHREKKMNGEITFTVPTFYQSNIKDDYNLAREDDLIIFEKHHFYEFMQSDKKHLSYAEIKEYEKCVNQHYKKLAVKNTANNHADNEERDL